MTPPPGDDQIYSSGGLQRSLPVTPPLGNGRMGVPPSRIASGPRRWRGVGRQSAEKAVQLIPPRLRRF